MVNLSASALGGYGHPFRVGTALLLAFGSDVVELVSATDRLEAAYRDVEFLRVGGPGAVTSGGGFVGGGFGLEGAAEGMAIAGLLNSLTTRTTVTTIVRELSQLAGLLEKGLVDRHEFDRLKGDILARMPGGS